MKKSSEPIEAQVLGKQVAYPKGYSPELLVFVPRSANREIYGLQDDNLPFVGYDVWHAYELGFLTDKGLPVSGVLKIIYPANSPGIVESKSLKLYLNGFNMSYYGANREDGIIKICEIIKDDLSELLKTKVELHFFDATAGETGFDFTYYELLEARPETENLNFADFKENQSLLKISDDKGGQIMVGTHLLRSKCRITGQPDWGSAYILLKGDQLPELSSLLKYIVSIRNENHFHEEICEMIYKRLWDTFSPIELMVSTIYTRRGGIDICPLRASKASLLPKLLTNVNQLSKKLIRQ